MSELVAHTKKTARRARRIEDQVRLGIIKEGEPEYPESNTYSSYHHGVPRYVKDKAEKMAAKTALMYVRRKAEGDPDKTRTARGILRGQAQMLLLIRVPNLVDVPEYLKNLEEELVTKAQAKLDRINS